MTKKSLSDLLKEEVNKADAPDPAIALPTDADEAPAVPKATASRRASRSSSSRRTAASRQSAKPEGKAKPAAKAKAEVAATQPLTAAAPAVAAPTVTDVDLAQRVSALEKDLATAEKDKAQLEKTVAGLQKDLETQQGRLFELKDSLAQSEAATKAKAEALTKTQAELDEAKKTILKLAETPAPAPAPTPAPAMRRTSGVDITPRRPMETKDRPTYHRGVPEYAIQKGQPNPMLTDADIGWVD
ncbi:MAG: hypothetical protein DCF32_19245 [Leptolyngbya sp.]|nr:MAG: hypothetical protein DCF32_19245 [Leptolyngbya sp.]